VAWDGKINGEVVEDGLYYYEIKTRIAYDDADWQVTQIPVYVDTEKPTVEAEFDQGSNEVQWSAEDEGSGLASVEVFVNGESDSGLLSPDETSHTVVDNIYDVNTITIVVTDWAGNKETVTVYDPDPSTFH